MSFHYTKRNYSKYYLIIFSVAGILLNVCLNYLALKMDLPMYLDIVGTIFVTFLGGVLPGIIVSLITSMLLNIFSPGYLYYSLITVIIAILAGWFFRYSKSSKILKFLYSVLTAALVCSVFGVFIQNYISGLPFEEYVEEIFQYVNVKNEFSYMLVVIFAVFLLNIVDKGIAIGLATLFFHLIPERTRDYIANYGWKQKPLTLQEIREARNISTNKAIHKKISVMLSTTICLLSVIMIWISITFYYEDCKEEYSDEAFAIVENAASILDGDEIYEYVKWGDKAKGYHDVENQMKMLLNNTQGVVKLSFFIPEQNGFLYLFQVGKEGVTLSDNGIIIPYYDEFSKYNDYFKNKEVIHEIMFNSDKSVMFASYPVRNSNGEIVCYAISDVYMSFLSEYARDYLMKIFLCFSGFVVMIMIFAFTLAGYELVIPINCITNAACEFLDSHGDQNALDENVRKTRSIGICTGDEVEQLYRTICQMESEMAEYVRDLRHFANTTRKTQTGLIITLAGIVESRDINSTSHVHNTAAYVRIILNGLKKKGYYSEKLSDEYMEEVEMSAPLHDIGKIQISDSIINKRDELTNEEEEIYKLHTVYGRRIMEKAITIVNDDTYLKEARNMAAYHHERWDGKGFPEGLHGEVIPLSARVMGLANELDELISPRGFKISCTLDEAIEIIKSESGKKFDPKCVDALLECISDVKTVINNSNFRRY
ncbi:HD domain-containing phosphohydrolase [Pseudobutyrivibrio xylanivorans]|uniref:HD domain-containing protein n=1 Tax=Pseudobutyrivibrio xylanivorans DSM 14809 TaxID=1123012 RepID=A0A1M6BFF7_PSEXY|nr:HD domain-containing phosphohydrolase [Pseudobutyrivibrio xylanivorans]SHI47480.1 HD domain-containing protein [Pseudobutyrivibrio xylanivorans DSM 14809]